MQHPGRRAFYKYVAPDTALAILQSKIVRYNSPLQFNDPFDHQTCLHLDFDLDAFPHKLLQKIEHLVRNPQIGVRKDAGPVYELIAFMRSKFSRHGFPGQRFAQQALPLLAEGTAEIERTRVLFEAHWQESLKANRTFCVAEDNDNLLMWSHYAKDHSGAVLELWSLPEEDNPLSVSSPVQYTETPPPFFTEEEFLNYFCGLCTLDLPALTRRSVYTKSSHWSYEREWRVYYPLSEKPGPFDEVGLRSSEFKAIYFGCKAEPSFVASARALLSANFPLVTQWAAERQISRYGVSFREI